MLRWLIKLFRKNEKPNTNASNALGGYYVMDKPMNELRNDYTTYNNEREWINDALNNHGSTMFPIEGSNHHSSSDYDNLQNQDFSTDNNSNYNSSMDSTNYDSTNNYDSGYSNDNNNW